MDEPKLALGPLGVGAVRLGPAARNLGFAEGIETGLSAMQLYGVSVWCSLGTTRLPKLALPDCVKTVVIYSDVGAPGQEAVALARDAYRAQGRRVLIAYPPEGGDFNDVLNLEAAK